MAWCFLVRSVKIYQEVAGSSIIWHTMGFTSFALSRSATLQTLWGISDSQRESKRRGCEYVLQTSGQVLITMGKCLRTSLSYPCSRAHACLIWTSTVVSQPCQTLKVVLLIYGELWESDRVVCRLFPRLFVRAGPEAVLPSMQCSPPSQANHEGRNKLSM